MEILFVIFALFGTILAFIFVSLQSSVRPSRDQERKAVAGLMRN
jgi:hypothetical protein